MSTRWKAITICVLLSADAWAQNTPDQRRCAIRLSAALLGQAPTAVSGLAASTNPQSYVDSMVTLPAFVERFARFINARLNRAPGDTNVDDATYYLAKHILQNGRPWAELYNGPYRLDRAIVATKSSDAAVTFTNGSSIVTSGTVALPNGNLAELNPGESIKLSTDADTAYRKIASISLGTSGIRTSGSSLTFTNGSTTVTSTASIALKVGDLIKRSSDGSSAFQKITAIVASGTITSTNPMKLTLENAYGGTSGTNVAASYWRPETITLVGSYTGTSGTGYATYQVPVATADPSVAADANGLGYFRDADWMIRYAGSESAGYRLVAAYRILQNMTGIVLTAAVNTAGSTATGRMASPCNSCHFNPTFGLDYVAKILTRKGSLTLVDPNTAQPATTVCTSPGVPAGCWAAPSEGAQTLFANATTLAGGVSISDDKQLVDTLAGSNDFKFWSCRMAFRYLRGRDEYKCDGALFDKCMAALNASGTIQAGVAAIAKDASFCR